MENNIPPESWSPDLIIAENERRRDRILLKGVDQYTGEGLPRHTVRVHIKDYTLKTQYLTEETANNQLYIDVRRAGSIRAYVAQFNTDNEHRLGGRRITSEGVARELMLVRIQNDPYFAFALLFTILYKGKGKAGPFILNYAQVLLLEELESMRLAGEPIRLILLKARQWGGSTLVQLYMAWIQLFIKEGWNSVIVAQTSDVSRRIKAMYTRTLENMKAAKLIFGISKLRFRALDESGSDYFVADAKGKKVRDNIVTVSSYEKFNSNRSADFAMAHYSEVTFWPETPSKKPEKVIDDINSNILEEPLTIEVMESTAMGMSGYFYEEYQLAKRHESARRALFIPFFYLAKDMVMFKSDKERIDFAANLYLHRFDIEEGVTTESGAYLWSLWLKGATLEGINWYIRNRRGKHSHSAMATEAPSDDIECFLFSGTRVFDISIVSHMRDTYARNPIYKGEIVKRPDGKVILSKQSPNGEFWIWAYPDLTPARDRYLVTVDVGGRTSKADYSVITVIDRWPIRFQGGKPEVVARWRGHIRFDYLAFKAVNIAAYYCNALLVIESNTLDKKKGLQAEFVPETDHVRSILTVIEGVYKNIYARAATDPEDIKQGIYTKLGFSTNKKTKPDMVDAFTVAVEDDLFIDPDSRVYEEMAIYELRADGSYGNASGAGNHDDILMTDMIGNFISRDLPIPKPKKSHSAARHRHRETRNESSF